MYTVAVTGHRPQKLWGFNMKDPRYEELGFEMCDFISRLYNDNCGPDNEMLLINGGAIGVDQIFWEESIAFRDMVGPGTVLVEAAAPCLNHSAKWPAHVKKHYEELLEQTDIKTIVTKAPYTPACMQKRNEYMVDKADAIIAVWNGKAGGTANCIEYAKKLNKKVIYIDPNDLEGD